VNRREILRLILVAPIAAIVIPEPEPSPLDYLGDGMIVGYYSADDTPMYPGKVLGDWTYSIGYSLIT